MERHSALQTVLAIAIVAAFFTVLNWPEIASRLAYGVPIPDARLRITLHTPMPLAEIVRRLDATMPEAGAEHNPEYADLVNSGSPVNRYSFTWYYDSDAMREDYRISLNVPFGVPNPESFELIFRNRSTGNFTEEEWRIFFDWKDRLVPAVFSEASTIEISRHPAEFTDIEDIESIANSLGVELPAQLSEKLKHENL